LNQLDVALELARKADADHKWKTLGDAGLAAWDVPLATECFVNAKDLGSLLLVYTSTADRDGLAKLAEQASAAGAHNVAFSCQWSLGDVPGCIDVLVKTGRLAEAVLFAQTYQPSLAAGLVTQWKEHLEKNKKGRVAKALGVPGEDEELFPEWEEWLRLEKQGPAVAEEANAEDGSEEEDEDDEEEESSEEEEE
jgi:coatomer subunit beta'